MERTKLFTYLGLAIVFLAIPITLVILQQRAQYRGEAAEGVFPADQPYFRDEEAIVCGKMLIKPVEHTYDPETGTLVLKTQFVNITNEIIKVQVQQNRCRCGEAFGQPGGELGYEIEKEWRMCFGDWPTVVTDDWRDPTKPIGFMNCPQERTTFTIFPKQFQEDILTTTTPPSAWDPNCGSFQADWTVMKITDENGTDICPNINDIYVPDRSAYGLLFTGKDFGGKDCKRASEVTEPTCAISPTTAQGDVPFSQTFSGEGSSDPDGSIEEYEWSLDGTVVQTSESQTYEANFTTAGEHTVSLVVIDNDGARSDICQAQVNANTPVEPNKPPLCIITSNPDPAQGVGSIEVTFDGSQSSDPDGQIASYDWSINTTPVIHKTGVSITETFSVGQYVATLTLTDNEGKTSTCSKPVTVTQEPTQPPVCDIVAIPTSGQEPLSVSFNDGTSFDTDGQLTSWEWTSGDGTARTTQTGEFSHSYTTAGTYTATLTVVDDDGMRSGLCTEIITVEEKPQKEPATHDECVGPTCTEVEGAGRDLCTSDDDCVAKVCTSEVTCEELAISDIRIGSIACETAEDCGFHNICHNFQCIPKRGAGVDECQTDADCEETYLTCEDMQCVEKIGQKEDTCRDDEDCYMKICDYDREVCRPIAVLQDQPDECETFDDCITDIPDRPEPPITTYMTCEDIYCVEKTGSPPEGTIICTSDEDCRFPDEPEPPVEQPTYKACVDIYCKLLAGTPPPGTLLCETDDDCRAPEKPPEPPKKQPTYKTCLEESCVVMAGTPAPGTQLCETDDDCKIPTPIVREEPVPTTGVESGAIAITVGAVVLLLIGLRLFL